MQQVDAHAATALSAGRAAAGDAAAPGLALDLPQRTPTSLPSTTILTLDRLAASSATARDLKLTKAQLLAGTTTTVLMAESGSARPSEAKAARTEDSEVEGESEERKSETTDWSSGGARSTVAAWAFRILRATGSLRP